MIRAPMLIADPSDAPSTVPRPRPAPARLLLFVGEVVRPDSALAELLGRDGLRCLWLPGPEQAQRAARLAVFDGVVVDGQLVDGEGGRRLAALRDALQAPILVVGRCDDLVDEIVALESGADAWLAPPFTPRRLRAHLGALVRRQQRAPVPAGEPPPAAGWALDPVRQRLVRGPQEVTLTEVQTLLLQCLFHRAGALVSRAQLAAALPHGERLQVRSVDTYLSRLRQKLRDERVHGFAIEAVRGRGFLLRLQDAAPEAQNL